MSRLISLIVLVAVILLIGALFYRVMVVFILPLFFAAILVVMFRPVHQWFLQKLPRRPRTAAGLTTTAVMLVVLAPTIAILALAINEGAELVRRSASAEQRKQLGVELDRWRTKAGLEMPYADEIRYLDDSLQLLAEDAHLGAGVRVELPTLETLHAAVATFRSRLITEREANQEQPELGQPATTSHTPAEPDAAASAPVEPKAADPTSAEAAHGERGESAPVEPAEATEPTEAPLELGLTELELLLKQMIDQPDSRPGTVQYRRLLQAAAGTFHHFKMDLYGGTVRAKAKELANPTDEQVQAYLGQALDIAPGWLQSLGGATGAALGQIGFGLFVMVLALYFFFVDGPVMVETLMRLSPLDDRHESELLGEFDRISRAVVIATLLSAVVQGMLAGIGFVAVGFWAAELHRVVFLLTVLTSVFALIPFVGAAAVWAPVAVWLFTAGHPVAAAALAIYGATVVSLSDNVIKPIVLHGQSNIHPLLALLSVIGGVSALGPIGVLVGPMIVVFLQTSLNILRRELSQRDGESSRAESAAPHEPAVAAPAPAGEDHEPPAEPSPTNAALPTGDIPSAAGPSIDVIR